HEVVEEGSFFFSFSVVLSLFVGETFLFLGKVEYREEKERERDGGLEEVVVVWCVGHDDCFEGLRF
ncbi:hypothetical protein ACHAW6_001750, partial [Cyclotella cf. meneghiniana]